MTLSIWRGPWVVHCQPVGKGQTALKYLATYIFRPAISNGRLLSLAGGIVSFRYKDSQTKQWTLCRLKALEFLRRYLQHVLPRGFIKVRYYGLYGHRHRERLTTLRDTLNQSAPKDTTESAPEAEPQSVPTAAGCRCCGRPMLVVATIPRGGLWPKAPPPFKAAFSHHPSQQTANTL